MGIIQDIVVAHARISERIDAAARAVCEWAASEAGQRVLEGFDYISVTVRAGDWYEHTGWYLPVHPALLRYALDRQSHYAPFDAREAVQLVGPGSTHWQWIVDGTLASPVLQSRAAVVNDAVDCMEHGRNHAAVSTLLPVIEGVISDRSGVLAGMSVGRRLDHLLHTESGPWETLCAVPALQVLDAEVFGRHSFAGVAIAENALNRHLVLHGRTAGFGTVINACRTFMLLVALVELLDGAIVLRACSVPADAWAVLDEFGPLARLRLALAARG